MALILWTFHSISVQHIFKLENDGVIILVNKYQLFCVNCYGQKSEERCYFSGIIFSVQLNLTFTYARKFPASSLDSRLYSYVLNVVKCIV